MKIFDPILLQKWTQGYWLNKPHSDIKNFCFDTRLLNANDCFLAIKNKTNDGHLFVNEAYNKGARAAIVEKEIPDCLLPQLIVKNTLQAFQNIAENYRKTLNTHIIAITGSCGKTTFKEILATLLGPSTFKTPGNFNNHLGIPLSITCIDPKIHSYAVIETGISAPGEMDILAKIISPDDAILINVNPVHLQNFSSIKSIGYEKFKLINAAKHSSFFPKTWSKFYTCNGKYYEYVNGKIQTNNNTISYHLDLTPNGWDIQINNQTFSIPSLCGNGAAESFAMAIGSALTIGISPLTIQERLQQLKPIPNRGVWQHKNGQHFFIDCYNANPAAFNDSLQHFYRTCPHVKSICYCLGSMMELGENSINFHKNLAKKFHIRPTDIYICIGTFKEALADGLKQQGAQTQQIKTFENSNEVTAFLAQLNIDCIYLKGSHCYHLENLVAG